MTELLLSSKGLNNFSNYTKDFTIVLNQNQIKISKHVAAFLSPTIAEMLSLNPSLSKFVISSDDMINSEDVLLFTNLVNCKSIEINDKNASFLFNIGKQFNNSEIIQQTTNFLFDSQTIDINNCIQRFKFKYKNKVDTEQEEQYIASHFNEIDENNFKEGIKEMFEIIFQREDLKVSKEDDIVDIIQTLDKENWYLLQYIKVENLTENGLSKYLQMIQEQELFNDIWNQISTYLVMMKKQIKELKDIQEMYKRKEIEARLPIEEFQYKQGKELDGILYSLQKKCGGNIHDKKCVKIRASWPTADPYYLGDLKQNHYNCASNLSLPNQWIEYDMIDKAILLTHYTIKNYNEDCHLEHWEILGSNDGENFTTIDTRNVQEPRGSIVLKTYEILNKPTEFYRYIRIKQTGPNSLGTNSYPYNCFEFFGKVKRILT